MGKNKPESGTSAWWAGQDAWMVATLVVSAVLISLPLTGGGLVLYMDNPPHLAEIHAAAHDAHHGWSDDAWCGFPVGSLHSPLLYTPLVWIARAGGPVDLFYFLAVLLGFMAPALALYKVGRRSLPAGTAALLAFCLMIQRPVIVGVGSAFGGMWTFYLATGFFILLVDVLARGSSRLPYLAASLTGLILASHLFPVAPVVLVSLIALLVHVVRGRLNPVQALVLGAGLGLGVLAAAWYWLPMLMVGELTHLDPQVLSPGQILARLVVPTDILGMLTNRMPAWSLGRVLGAVPMILLVAAGLAGAVFMKRRRDDGPVYGLVLAAVVLLMLTLVVGKMDVKVLGPVTWRLLYFARIGLALAALPALVLLPRMGARKTAILAPLFLVVAFFSGIPLEKNTPDPQSQDMVDIRRVWSWLENNHQPEWGRVHLQDTFQLSPGPNGLGASHVLALTARETGARQVGSVYSIAPYPTAPWTASEFSTLFGKAIRQPADVQHVVDKCWFANATHILSSNPRTAALLKASGAFESLYVSGRFEVLHWLGYAGEWANRFGDGKGVPGVDFEPGRIMIPLGSEAYPEGIMVKATYHPFWRVSGQEQVKLAAHPSGLIEIRKAQAGQGNLELEFVPPVWPRLVSLLAVMAIALMAWRDRFHGKRAGS